MPWRPKSVESFLKGVLLGGAILTAPTLRAQDDAASKDWIARAREHLRGQSISIGAGYAQGTFKLGRFGDSLGRSEQTDNGRMNLLFDYSGGDKVLKLWPMSTGQFLLGWNLTATAGTFKVDRQLISSALRGDDAGTSLKGGYLAGAPCLFIRIGPLWEDREIYCAFGFGVGAGAIRYSGNALFGADPGTLGAVGGNSVRAAMYDKAYWQFQVGHWILEFDSKYFLVRDPTYSPASYEVYGLGLAYQITF